MGKRIKQKINRDKDDKDDVNFYNTAQAQAMYEMYLAGDYLHGLASVFKMDENQVAKIIKGYKNNYADESERDADTGDIIIFTHKNCKIIGKVLKRYKYTVLVEYKEKNVQGDEEDKIDLYLSGNKCLISDRDYRIIKRKEQEKPVENGKALNINNQKQG